MRVAVNGLPLLAGQRTGIGYYVFNLLRSLAAAPEIEDLSVALLRNIVPARELLTAAEGTHLTRSRSVFRIVRSALVRTIPFHRAVIKRIWELQLRTKYQHGNYNLFHEPNYAGPDIGRPLVTTVCDLGYLRFPQFMPKDRVVWLRRQLEPRLECSSAIITISQFVREELLDIFPAIPAEKVFVTPLGVCTQRFHNKPDPDGVARLRRELSLPEKFFLFLGTLDPRKNVQGLLSAFSLLPRAMRRDCPLVLAGAGGWQQHYFRSLMDQLVRDGSLRIVGYIDAADVPLLLKAATVFCFPSLYEGFGLPVLEAAACGTPVLSSREASLPEVIGDAACYVDANSVESIADGMMRLMNDQRRRHDLASQGFERSLQFSWDRCARATIEAYRFATDLSKRRSGLSKRCGVAA